MSILFLDRSCPKPYDLKTLQTESLGGTEGTVVRIAEGLASDAFVQVEQHNMLQASFNGKAWYAPKADTKPDNVTSVVCLRDPRLLTEAKARFPKARLLLWLHDLASEPLRQSLATIVESKADLICVSQFHKWNVVEALKTVGYTGQFRVHVIYNPIDDALVPDDTPVDPHQLVFFSSPHKGLEYALEVFSGVRRFDPRFRLLVANPGYLPSLDRHPEGVTVLGALPHAKAIAHVRSSLCVFYPNVVFPETFGLVFAEANAVGTPCITHRLGAASEVTDHPYEVLNCFDRKAVIDRVLAWSKGDRPLVKGRKEFRLSRVLQEWKRVLG